MARIHRAALIDTIADLLKQGKEDIAVQVAVTLGKLEIATHLKMLMDDNWLYERDELPTSFGTLHDTCDANEFGGLCDDRIFDVLEAQDNLCGFGNKVQNELHAMLQRGAIEPEFHTFIND